MAAAARVAAATGRAAKRVETVTEEGAQIVASRGRRVRVNPPTSAERPVITCMVVVVGAKAAHGLLTDQKWPTRNYWLRIAVLGFGLSLLSEVTPAVGKYMSYLIMAGVLFVPMGESRTSITGEVLNSLRREEKATPPSPIPDPFTEQGSGGGGILYQRPEAMINGEPVLPARPYVIRPQRGPFR
jgi:hypothetical protein